MWRHCDRSTSPPSPFGCLRTRHTHRGQPRIGSKFQIGKAATRHAGETSVFFCCCRKTPRKRNHTAALLTSPVHVLEGQTFQGAQTTLWASCVNFLQASIKLSTPDWSFSFQMIPKLIFCYRTILLNSIRQDRKYNQWGHFKVGQISKVIKVSSPVKTSGWAPMTTSLPSKYQLAVLHLHLSLPSKISCTLQIAFGDILIMINQWIYYKKVLVTSAWKEQYPGQPLHHLAAIFEPSWNNYEIVSLLWEEKLVTCSW